MNITPFKVRIKEYLDSLAKKDKLFKKTYAKTNKNLDECCNYIIQEVKNAAKNKNQIAVADDEIYSLAVHYYDEDDIKVASTTPKVKITHSDDSKKPSKKRITTSAKTKKISETSESNYVPMSLEIPLFG